MSVVHWKVSTLVAFGAAIGLARYPIRTSSEGLQSREAAVTVVAATPPARPQDGAPQILRASTKARLLTRLDAVRTSFGRCETLQLLAPVADEQATSRIMDIARTGSHVARACAIEALGRRRSAAARSLLRELTSHPDAIVREAAVKSLGQFRDDVEARDPLLVLAKGGDGDVRVTAMLALANARAPEVAPLLLGALPTVDGDTESRIIVALGQVGGKAAVDALMKMAREGNHPTRMRAIAALARLQGPRAVPFLATILSEASAGNARAIVRALGHINSPRAREVLIDTVRANLHQTSADALSALRDDESDEVRGVMRESLTSQLDDVCDAAARYFAAHPDPTVLHDLVQVAGRFGLDSSAEAIGALHATDAAAEARAALVELASKPSKVRGSALRQLNIVPGGIAAARPIAAQVLADRQEGWEEVAAEILAADGSPESTRILMDEAKRGERRRLQVMSWRAQHGDPDGLRGLLELVRNGKQGDVRNDAVRALWPSQGRGPQIVKALVVALADPNPEVRGSAVTTLGWLGGPEAERAMSLALRRADPAVQTAVVAALGVQTPWPSAPTLLAQMSANPDDEVALEALQHLAEHDPALVGHMLKQRYRSGTPEARRRVISRAWNFKPDVVRSLLVEGLSDTDSAVVEAAASSLVAIGDEPAAQVLVRMLGRSDVSDSLKRMIAGSIFSMGGDVLRQNAGIVAQYRS